MVQQLTLCASNAGDAGLIPGWGTKIPHAARQEIMVVWIKVVAVMVVRSGEILNIF